MKALVALVALVAPLTILTANLSLILLKAFAVADFGFQELSMGSSLQIDKLGGFLELELDLASGAWKFPRALHGNFSVG